MQLKEKAYRNTSSIVNRTITQRFAHVSDIFFHATFYDSTHNNAYTLDKRS